MMVAEGDIDMLPGRYIGCGPKPLVALDIFRVVKGRIVELWDVLHDQVVSSATGNPMFEPGQ